MLTVTEQRLQDLEKVMAEHRNLSLAVSQMLPPAAAKERPRLAALVDQVRRLRVAAFQSLQQGDVYGLVRALGVNHAFDACVILGVGSVQALTSCTRNQFALWARPQNLGWGAADAVPPRIDPDVVSAVEGVLRSLGLRWREAHEKPRVRLPEPVLSRAFNTNFDPKKRFGLEDFSSYAHPSLVRGIPGQFGQITHELNARGIYSFEDMSLRSIADLKRTGLAEPQLSLVQWEMRRRGMTFQKEQPMAAVEMDAIDVDKINRDDIDEKDVLSFEDKIKVRDKVGTVVGIINSANEFEDRAGAESDDVHAGYGDQGSSAMGVKEAYVEENEGEDVRDEDDAQSAQQPAAPSTGR